MQKENASLKAKAASSTALSIRVGKSRDEFGVKVQWVDGIIVRFIVMKTEVLVGEAGYLAAVESP